MRVNKMFYSIAAPILYIRIITIQPDLLLFEIHSKPISTDRLSKLELFQYIRRLDLVYDPSHCSEDHITPPINKNDMILSSRAGIVNSGRKRWPAGTLVRDIDLARRVTFKLETLRKEFPEGVNLFSNLKCIIIGAFSKTQHSRWDVGYCFLSTKLDRFNQPFKSNLGFALRDLLYRKQQEGKDIMNMRYKFGYELTSNYMINNLKSYTIHISKSMIDTSASPIPIIPGIINKWIISNDKYTWSKYKDMGDPNWIAPCGSVYQWLMYALYKSYENGLAFSNNPNTKLIIYGMLNPKRVDEEFSRLKSIVEHWEDD
ncbi:uncharacterized protein L201_000171 [Kwoniella dendrophila CBS 6074]|uniref:Uncharacterized protein n=1 Tax=Kwoniella dendrophila CBS 6074 TaxID=1295534 RepID=A0AAX4JKA2_9TREE